MTALRLERRRRRAITLAAVLLLAVPVAGCQAVETPAADVYQPASLGEPVATGAREVTFTAEASERIALTTERAAARGSAVSVPYAALIYDGQGLPWVYTATGPGAFLRTKVVVTRIDGDQALLSVGPSPGTAVVTTGAAEVYGAELDIAGSH